LFVVGPCRLEGGEDEVDFILPPGLKRMEVDGRIRVARKTRMMTALESLASQRIQDSPRPNSHLRLAQGKKVGIELASGQHYGGMPPFGAMPKIY
jgi:hypothetical protein